MLGFAAYELGFHHLTSVLPTGQVHSLHFVYIIFLVPLKDLLSYLSTVPFQHQTVYSYESMAAVFVRDPHSVRQSIFQDLSAIMSLLTNMKSFTIDTRIISDVQRTRNQYYAHNYTAPSIEGTDILTTTVFSTLATRDIM
jgi:hypothetical protein